MSDLAAAFADRVYDHLVRNRPLPPPNPHLALFTGSGDDDELAVGGYVRPAVSFTLPVDGAGANVEIIYLGPLPEAGRVTHGALFDGPAGGVRMSRIVPLATPRSWKAGDMLEIPRGAVVFSVR